jgi:hypothetical protein
MLLPLGRSHLAKCIQNKVLLHSERIFEGAIYACSQRDRGSKRQFKEIHVRPSQLILQRNLTCIPRATCSDLPNWNCTHWKMQGMQETAVRPDDLANNVSANTDGTDSLVGMTGPLDMLEAVICQH